MLDTHRLIRDSHPNVAKHFVAYCVGRFVESAHAVWWPDARAKIMSRNNKQS